MKGGCCQDDKGGGGDWVSWFEDGDCLGLEVGRQRGGLDQWVWGIKSNRWAEVVVLAGASYVTSQTKYGEVVWRGHRM